MIYTPQEILQSLGAAIRARRVAQNWSQGEAASRAGIGVRTWRRMEASGQAATESLVNAAIVLRCEERLLELFPAPAARNMDELLEQQRSAAPAKRARARKGRRT